MKSFESRITIPETDEPTTLRIPISRVRCWIENEASPRRPRQATKTARKGEDREDLAKQPVGPVQRVEILVQEGEIQREPGIHVSPYLLDTPYGFGNALRLDTDQDENVVGVGHDRGRFDFFVYRPQVEIPYHADYAAWNHPFKGKADRIAFRSRRRALPIPGTGRPSR